MAGATLMAEQAARVEAAAEGGDLAGARRAADGMEALLADTLRRCAQSLDGTNM